MNLLEKATALIASGECRMHLKIFLQMLQVLFQEMLFSSEKFLIALAKSPFLCENNCFGQNWRFLLTAYT